MSPVVVKSISPPAQSPVPLPSQPLPSLGVPYNEGKQQIIDLISSSDRYPLLIAVYGIPNGGKSHLIGEMVNHFSGTEIWVAGAGGAPRADTFEMIQRHSRSFPNIKAVYQFHCGWDRDSDERINEIMARHEDPGCLAREILGREIDLKVCIYNPLLTGYPYGKYDLVICNPHSRPKPPIGIPPNTLPTKGRR